ncbi:TPA: hypothetical protein ACH3X1_000596 [Trebouxia sp. C0004]
MQYKAKQGPVVVSAVQRSQSPSRAPTFGRLTVPEAASAVSSHPDAIRRRREAEARWEIHNPSNMHLVASTEEFRERIRLAKGENTLVVVNAGIDCLQAMCQEIGVPKLPYFHFVKGDNGIVAEFAADLTAQKLQQLRTQIAQHSAQ